MIVALILLLGMAIPITLILLAVGTDAFLVLWLGISGASEAWRERVRPWFATHLPHHRHAVIARR